MLYLTHNPQNHTPWNKGKLIGQKPPLKLHEIWAIRIRLQITKKTRDLALFNLALDSKLRSCDLVNLKVRDIAHGKEISKRAMFMQKKQSNPSNFKSRSKLVNLFQIGLNRKICLMMIIFFRVVSANRSIFLLDNMHEY